MADHLIGKFWGLSGALVTALLTLALIAPAGAEAAGPGSAALSQLAALVPAPAQSAVSAALSQAPSANGAAASAVAVPESPPPVHVVVPPPPSVPVVARPTPPPAPANPAPAAPLPVPVPAGVASLAVSVPAESVPQPDAAVQAAVTERNPSSTARPDAALGGPTPPHRLAHRRAHRHAGSPRSVSAASTRRAPIARPTAAGLWSPVSVLETSRRGTQPAAPARRADSRSESRRARHVDAAAIPSGRRGDHGAGGIPTLGRPAARRSRGQRCGRRRRSGGRGRRGSPRTFRPLHSSSLVAGALRPGARPSAIGVPRLEVGTAWLAPLRRCTRRSPT